MTRVIAFCLILVASPAWAAIAWVQDTTPSNAASATSVTVNFGAATTTGNFIFCAAVVKDVGGCCQPITFSDSAGNSYTALTSQGVSNSALRAAYAMNASAATWAKATAAGTSDYLTITCAEFSGVKTSAAADGFSTAAPFSNPANSGNIITTNAADILFGVGASINVTCTLSTGSAGYTDDAVQSSTTTQEGIVLAHKIVAATGTYSFDTGASCGGGSPVASQIAAFQAASGGAPPAASCGRLTLLGVGC